MTGIHGRASHLLIMGLPGTKKNNPKGMVHAAINSNCREKIPMKLFKCKFCWWENKITCIEKRSDGDTAMRQHLATRIDINTP